MKVEFYFKARFTKVSFHIGEPNVNYNLMHDVDIQIEHQQSKLVMTKLVSTESIRGFCEKAESGLMDDAELNSYDSTFAFRLRAIQSHSLRRIEVTIAEIRDERYGKLTTSQNCYSLEVRLTDQISRFEAVGVLERMLAFVEARSPPTI